MSRLLSIVLLACFLFISPASAFLDMQSNAIFFDGAGHGDQVINGILDLICATKNELLIQMYGFSGHDEVDIRLQDHAIGQKIRDVFYSDWQDACENFDCIDQ